MTGEIYQTFVAPRWLVSEPVPDLPLSAEQSIRVRHAFDLARFAAHPWACPSPPAATDAAPPADTEVLRHEGDRPVG